MCTSMVDIQSPTAEIRRGKKRKKKKKKIERNYRMKILWSALLHRATTKRNLLIPVKMEAAVFFPHVTVIYI